MQTTMEIIVAILILAAIGVAKWLVYTGLLYAMIRVQKLNCHVLGLFGSSLLGTVISYLPVVGPYAAWAVLVLCLWKCTGAEIVPDVFFTVTIASALMFCVNLFVIGALMGDLRVNARTLPIEQYAEGWEGDDLEGEEMTNADEDVKAEGVRPLSLAAAPRQDVSASATNSAPPQSATAPDAPGAEAIVYRDAGSLPTKLTLKGVTLSGTEKLAMISSGKQIHTIGIGEAFSIPAPRGMMKLVCEEITQTAVILALDKGEKVKLPFY